MSDKVLTRKEGALRWLIFNQPKKLNAISLEMAEAALKVVENFASAEDERVMIVTGAGDKAFVSGADISEFEKTRNNNEAASRYDSISAKMFFGIRDVEKPTVAMIQGYCFGGGVAVASCCDIRLCADDAVFSVPAARLGVGYSAAFVKLLADLIGPSRAKEFLYTARRYSADEAYAMGLVNRVIPKAELEDTVRAYAEDMARNAPLTQRATKIIFAELLKPESKRDMEKCERAVAACFDSEDFKNARRAFMKKRKPVFNGR